MTTREIPGEHPTCIGGGRCVCYRGTEHEHCICGNPKCACHEPAAYRLTKAVLRNGEEVYAATSAEPRRVLEVGL